MFRKITLLLGMTLLFVGCQTLSERKQANALSEVLKSYHAMIRWGSVEQAKGFLLPDTAKSSAVSRPADLRVTHYEVVQGPTMVSNDKAVQTAVIQYVFEDTQIVRELVDQQTWEYDTENERWYLLSPLPTFK